MPVVKGVWLKPGCQSDRNHSNSAEEDDMYEILLLEDFKRVSQDDFRINFNPYKEKEVRLFDEAKEVVNDAQEDIDSLVLDIEDTPKRNSALEK